MQGKQFVVAQGEVLPYNNVSYDACKIKKKYYTWGKNYICYNLSKPNILFYFAGLKGKGLYQFKFTM